MTSRLLLAAIVVTACSSSGSSGGGPPIDDPHYGQPLDPKSALLAAVFEGSCIPDDRANRLLADAYYDVDSDPFDGKLHRGAIACLAAKTNGCQAVQDCLGISVDSAGGPCTEGCSGTVATACDDPLKFTVDCGRYGLSCNSRGCLPPLPACDRTTFVPSCDGGAPTFCNSDGLKHGLKCADYGMECGTQGMGTSTFAFCRGTGPVCNSGATTGLSISSRNGIACDGAKLRACVNGNEATFDCATIGKGFTCQSGTIGGKSVAFCGLAAECDPTVSSQPSCEGNDLVVCNAGRIEKVDCTALGFSGCNATAKVCSPSPW
ncbi:MAG: hypothetical protein ACXWUG_16980 [Polyangiales bacterium]